ncbi:hypothetical protein MHYP_G00297250 [Metynnis hypsauchen]
MFSIGFSVESPFLPLQHSELLGERERALHLHCHTCLDACAFGRLSLYQLAHGRMMEKLRGANFSQERGGTVALRVLPATQQWRRAPESRADPRPPPAPATLLAIGPSDVRAEPLARAEGPLTHAHLAC